MKNLCFKDAFAEKKSLKKAKALYDSAFPAAEKMPFAMLKNACKKGKAHFFAVYDGNEFIGIVYLVEWDKTASVFYFAVEEKSRQKGYGSRILSMIKEKYDEKTVFLDIEKPSSEENDIRLRRKRFYERNGFSYCGFDVTEFGVTYEILAFGGEFTAEGYRRFMKFFCGKFIYRLFYKKMIG